MSTYVVGDIHGCYYTLKKLISSLNIQESDKLIFLGDYIDRGPHSKDVVEYVKNLSKDKSVIALKGNHEQMCVYGFDKQLWLHNGGVETLKSYDDRTPEEKKMPSFKEKEARQIWLKNQPTISKEHMEWIMDLPLYHEDENYFYVHAGVNPVLSLDEQTEQDMLWIREPFIQSEKDFNKTIIFGHTPFKKVFMETNKIGIDTGCVYGNYLTAFETENGVFFQQKIDERDYNEYSKRAKR